MDLSNSDCYVEMFDVKDFTGLRPNTFPLCKKGWDPDWKEFVFHLLQGKAALANFPIFERFKKILL